MRIRLLPFLLGTAALLPAQANVVPGLDGRLTNIDEITYYGRRGPFWPNGEIGFAFANTMCNPGSVEIPWQQAMQPNHPKFGFMMTRYSGGRMVQINDARSYCKHAFTSTNSASTCGGNCINPGTGQRMGIRCSDTYGAVNNSDRYWLGPPEEIDPWLGTWNPVGSYFDRGDPDVGPPGNSNGGRSLTQTQIGAFDPVKNRIAVREQELLVANAKFYYCIQLIHQGEAAANRGDNLAYRGFIPTWYPLNQYWTVGNNNNPGFRLGTVLNEWPGASVSSARNGNDDGTFFVAVAVTGPVNGVYHYEYAVHNFDNSRGGASLRIPVCPGATISNVGFRDIDDNALNQWSWTRQGGELAFQAPAGNPLNWNQIFNFWFDSDAPPAAAPVRVDQARLGNGALSVAIASSAPIGIVRVLDLGPGCGTSAPALAANGTAAIPAPGFRLDVTATPGAGLFAFDALGTASVGLGAGCFQYLAPATLTTHGFFLADGAGAAAIPLPVPNDPTLEGLTLYWQVAEVAPGGPVAGLFALSNGLGIRVGNAVTCQ